MDIFGVAAVSLCSVVIALLLKRRNEEYTMLLSLVTVIMLMVAALQNAAPMISEIQALTNSGLFNNGYIEILMKTIGITIISQVTVNICKDSGQSAVAYGVNLAGKVAVLVIAMPIITGIFSYINEILAL